MSGFCAVCQIPAELKCARCHSVNYCGQQHQKKDWPRHQASTCLPYMVKPVASGRRYVFAARDLKKGEIIIDEVPLALSPLTSCCPGCYRTYPIGKPPPARCPRCWWPVCSRKCPGLTDPAFHGAECDILREIKSAIVVHNLEALLPLRCLLLQKTQPEKWKLLHKLALQAESLPVERSLGENGVYLEDGIFKPLSSAAPHLFPQDHSSKTIQRIISTIDSYSILFNRPNHGELIGICAVSSYMNHSCMPNTQVIFEDPEDDGEKLSHCRIIVRAAENIPKGGYIATTFVEMRNPTISRQRDLSIYRAQQCTCDRCMDGRELGTDLGTLKCETCSGWILPLDTSNMHKSDWQCENCGKTLTALEVMTLVEEIRTETMNTEFLDKFEKAKCLFDVREKAEKLLHPNHSLLLMIKIALIRSFRISGADQLHDHLLNEPAEVCREVIRVMLNPYLVKHMNEDIGVALLALSNLNLEIMKRKKASKQIDSLEAKRLKKECSEFKAMSMRFTTGDYSELDVEILRGKGI